MTDKNNVSCNAVIPAKDIYGRYKEMPADAAVKAFKKDILDNWPKNGFPDDKYGREGCEQAKALFMMAGDVSDEKKREFAILQIKRRVAAYVKKEAAKKYASVLPGGDNADLFADIMDDSLIKVLSFMDRYEPARVSVNIFLGPIVESSFREVLESKYIRAWPESVAEAFARLCVEKLENDVFTDEQKRIVSSHIKEVAQTLGQYTLVTGKCGESSMRIIYGFLLNELCTGGTNDGRSLDERIKSFYEETVREFGRKSEISERLDLREFPVIQLDS